MTQQNTDLKQDNASTSEQPISLSLKLSEWQLRRQQTKTTKIIVKAAFDKAMSNMDNQEPASPSIEQNTKNRTVTLRTGLFNHQALHVQYVPNKSFGEGQSYPNYNIWSETDTNPEYTKENVPSEQTIELISDFITNHSKYNTHNEDTMQRAWAEKEERAQKTLNRYMTGATLLGSLGLASNFISCEHATQEKDEPKPASPPPKEEPDKRPSPPRHEETGYTMVAGTDYYYTAEALENS